MLSLKTKNKIVSQKTVGKRLLKKEKEKQEMKKNQNSKINIF